MYHFIINPKSRTGRGYHIWLTVKKKLDELNIPYTYHFTHYESHAYKIAKKLSQADSTTKRIVVLGGDGTFNEVINGLSSYRHVLLGYIPSGSSNDLAKSLGIPSDPLEALDLVLRGNYYDYYDHGQLTILDSPVTTRRFAVSSGIGFDASICYEALHSNLKKGLNKLKLGQLTYISLAIKQLCAFKPVDGELIIDGYKHIPLKRIFFVASMIHPYEGGGVKMYPHANPCDQKLSVCVVYDIKKLSAIYLLPLIRLGLHKPFHGIKLLECTTLEIKLKEPQLIHTDGEYAGSSDHIRLSCFKEQVRMIGKRL